MTNMRCISASMTMTSSSLPGTNSVTRLTSTPREYERTSHQKRTPLKCIRREMQRSASTSNLTVRKGMNGMMLVNDVDDNEYTMDDVEEYSCSVSECDMSDDTSELVENDVTAGDGRLVSSAMMMTREWDGKVDGSDHSTSSVTTTMNGDRSDHSTSSVTTTVNGDRSDHSTSSVTTTSHHLDRSSSSSSSVNLERIVTIHHPLTSSTLTFDDFRLSRISPRIRAPFTPRNQLVVILHGHDPTFKSLSSFYSRGYFRHHIPGISNDAPTIQQLFTELMVYRADLETPSLNSRPQPMLDRRPRFDFFESANINFASANNVRPYRLPSRKPLYYYAIDSSTGEPIHMPLRDARRLFCKMYEKDVMGHAESKTTFMMLLKLCQIRDRSMPVVMRGLTAIDSFDRAVDVESLYDDMTYEFGCECCLIEMLLRYPKLNECVWNREG